MGLLSFTLDSETLEFSDVSIFSSTFSEFYTSAGTVLGQGATNTSFGFGSDVRGDRLRMTLDGFNLVASNIPVGASETFGTLAFETTSGGLGINNFVNESSVLVTNISAVPIPAGLPLLLLSVGALGVLRRRQDPALR